MIAVCAALLQPIWARDLPCGEAALRDAEGYFWLIGRTDDVLIRVSGHRLGREEIEDAIVVHPGVAEAAVVGHADAERGDALSAFVILTSHELEGNELTIAIRESIAQRIGEHAKPKQVFVTREFPRTRSGKILRYLLRDILEGEEPRLPESIADPSLVSRLTVSVHAQILTGGGIRTKSSHK